MNRKDLEKLRKIVPKYADLVQAVWDCREDSKCGAAREPIVKAAMRLVPQEELD